VIKDSVALLKAAQKLDEEALTAIFDEFAPAIYKYALRLCHDAITADNIVGDVFAQLLEQFAGGKRSTHKSAVLSIPDCLSPCCRPFP